MEHLAQRFVARALDQPASTALVWRGRPVTYGALHRQASHQQQRLDRLGAGTVALQADRSPEGVALVLGCLLRGTPFLLPPRSTPAPVLDQLLERTGCGHVVSPRAHRVAVHGATAVAPADGVGFVLTTSGTTGTPKPVPLPGPAVDRFVEWATEAFGFSLAGTVLSYAPLNFDLSLLEVWSTLAVGGSVLLAEERDALDGARLLRLLAGHRVTLVQAVPLVYRLLVDAMDEHQRLPHVQHVLLTGDHLPNRSLRAVRRLFDQAELHNVYGCTETNDSFIHHVQELPPEGERLPLGTPLPGVRARLVREDGSTVHGAGSGELWVSTPFQTTGYMGGSDDRFLPEPGGRSTFRTRDLVRRDAAGRLTHEGRMDSRVKVRGALVNLEAVEQVLLGHPAVLAAAVGVVPDEVSGELLRAVVRRRPGGGLESLTLRRHCALALTPSAVPSQLRIVDRPLPMTSTGKVLRAAALDLWNSPDLPAHDDTTEPP